MPLQITEHKEIKMKITNLKTEISQCLITEILAISQITEKIT